MRCGVTFFLFFFFRRMPASSRRASTVNRVPCLAARVNRQKDHIVGAWPQRTLFRSASTARLSLRRTRTCERVESKIPLSLGRGTRRALARSRRSWHVEASRDPPSLPTVLRIPPRPLRPPPHSSPFVSPPPPSSSCWCPTSTNLARRMAFRRS